METIVLATTNKHKISEIKSMLKGFKVISLEDIGFTTEIEETGTTMEANAKIKAMAVLKFCIQNGLDYSVVADDSGLCVNALNGAPGVNSARYAGDHDNEANRQKLLAEMQDKIDRTAYYECAICLARPKEVRLFVGRTFGEITTEKIGDESFAYDCVFYSTDLEKTFGEASQEEKNAISHRGKAIQKLVEYLNDKSNPNFDRTIVFNK